LADNLTLGDALSFLEGLVRDHLPGKVIIDYKGQSQDFKNARGSILFVFLLGGLVVYLVLAAQFESWVHPFIISSLSVPVRRSSANAAWRKRWITSTRNQHTDSNCHNPLVGKYIKRC